MNTNSHEWRHGQVGYRAVTEPGVFNTTVIAVASDLSFVNACPAVSIRGFGSLSVRPEIPVSR